MPHDQPELTNTRRDIVASLAKGITGMIPILGSLIAEIIGNLIPNQRVDRIVEFTRLLEERLGQIEEDILKSRFAEPAVVDLLEDAFNQAARATTQDRLAHIADVVAHGISAEEMNQAESKRMLWLLGQLNDAEIIILRSKRVITGGDAVADAEFRGKHKELLAPSGTHMGSSEEDFENEALEDSYRQHLNDLGLIRYRFKPRRNGFPEFDDMTGMMKASGTEVTRLGRMLLRYLNLIPPWFHH